ncbi:MAG: hypothetical protein L0211_04970 [Planctomycetaceae bacterium]|nr:hypothetical protein [Planctomycetaceae bacterium]
MCSTAGANLQSAAAPAISRQLAEAVWWTAAVLAIALSALLLLRRLGGAIINPLSGTEFVAAAAVLTLLVFALQLAAQHQRVAVVVLALAAVVGLAAITIPGTPPWSACLSWFGLVTAQSAVLVTNWRHARVPRHSSIRAAVVEEYEEAISEQLVQRIARERTPGGGESIHALVRATCPPGDQTAVVHVAFCPPLDAAPRLTAHVLDDSGAETRITLAESYGARIEVRLPHAAPTARTVLVEVLGSVVETAAR